MRKWLAVSFTLVFVLCSFVVVQAADNPLVDGEKAFWKMFKDVIPADRILNVDQFHALYTDVMAGKEKAYLIDVRTHPEFYAGHIPGTDHIHAGHMYTIPKKIKDADAKIVVWCRTSHRAVYAAGMLIKYGYKNVWMYDEGVVGWMKAGHELCNQFMGKFKVTEYHKDFSGDKDPFNVREFHPF